MYVNNVYFGREPSETYLANRCNLDGTLHGDLKLQVVEVFALADAKIASEEDLLQFGNLRSDITILTLPLIDFRRSKPVPRVSGLVSDGSIVDRRTLRPPCCAYSL